MPYAYETQLLSSVFGGLVGSSVLYGITCVQVLYYFTHQNDKWPLKLLVSTVMFLDTLHQAFITHTVLDYTVTRWGNSDKLAEVNPSLILEVLFGVLIALLVQGFMAARMWRLSNGSLILTIPVVLLAIGEFVFGLIYVIKAIHLKSLSDLMTLTTDSILINGLAAACDVLITASLCTLLHLSRSGLRRSDTVINKLILFTVNTGLLTSICATFTMSTMFGAWAPFVCLPFFFCLGRLYSNTLLATLNAREMVRNAGENLPTTTNNFALSLSHFSRNGTTSGEKDIPVRIDTSTHTTTDADEEHGPDDPKLSVHFVEQKADVKKSINVC